MSGNVKILGAKDDFAIAGKQRIVSTCYELYMILAETIAQQQGDPRERARQSLAILDQAAKLGLKPKADHLFRKRFLEQLGDNAGAAEQEKLAESTPAVTALDHFLVGIDAKRRGRNSVLTEANDAFHARRRP